MLMLSSTYPVFKLGKTLNVIYYKDKEDPEIIEGIKILKSSSSYVFRLGEHMTVEGWFNQFNTIVFHPTKDEVLEDYLDKFNRYNFMKPTVKFSKSEDQNVIFTGNVSKLLNPKPVLFPHDKVDNNKSKKLFVRQPVFLPKGLGLVPTLFDINYDPKAKDDTYKSALNSISEKQKIFLLSPDAVVYQNGRMKAGTMYVYFKGKIDRTINTPKPGVIKWYAKHVAIHGIAPAIADKLIDKIKENK